MVHCLSLTIPVLDRLQCVVCINKTAITRQVAGGGVARGFVRVCVR